MPILNRRAALLGAASVASALSPELAHAGVQAATAAEWGLAFGDLDEDVSERSLDLIHGKAPADLSGVLYRNGGARFRRRGGDAAHWFDGDGLIRRYSLQAGAAKLSARFVDTPKRRADAAAKAVVSGGFGTASAPSAVVSSPDDVNAANISVITRGNELWALWEAGSPIAVDPTTLATLGPKTLREDLVHAPFLAHPRFEPDGSLWSLGQVGRQMVVWRLDAKGALLAATPLALPRASYVHDFTTTARHIVIVLQPWISESTITPVIAAMHWRPELGVQVMVLDKADLTQHRLYDLPSFFHFHMGSAWVDKGGAIRFDICIDPDPSFAIQGGVDILKGVYRPRPSTRLALVSLHPDGRAELEPTAVDAEFPRTDSRFNGQVRAFTLHASVKSKDRPLFQGVGLYDWRSGKDAAFDFGEHQLVEEMVFVPRRGGSDEMDGYVIGPTINLKAKASELHVFDARRLAEGPICTWRADIAVPAGLHGMFVAS
jgi:carotenoid cleavage dioxygenase-like enzyme